MLACGVLVSIEQIGSREMTYLLQLDMVESAGTYESSHIYEKEGRGKSRRSVKV